MKQDNFRSPKVSSHKVPVNLRGRSSDLAIEKPGSSHPSGVHLAHLRSTDHCFPGSPSILVHSHDKSLSLENLGQIAVHRVCDSGGEDQQCGTSMCPAWNEGLPAAPAHGTGLDKGQGREKEELFNECKVSGLQDEKVQEIDCTITWL